MSLPSWNDTPTKKAVLDFMISTNDKNNPGYIPLSERVAAFDNDGTLWVEQPAPAQTGMLISKLLEQVKAEPSLAEIDPYKGIVTQDPDFMQAMAQQVPEAIIAFLSGVGKDWEGTTPGAYEAEVQIYLTNTKHPRYKRPWTDLVYQPMLELFDLLSEKGYGFQFSLLKRIDTNILR